MFVFPLTFVCCFVISYYPWLFIMYYANIFSINFLYYLSKSGLDIITLVAMNGEWVEGLVTQMKGRMAGLDIDLLGDFKMEILVGNCCLVIVFFCTYCKCHLSTALVLVYSFK